MFALFVAALALLSTQCASDASDTLDKPDTPETPDQSATKGAELFPEVPSCEYDRMPRVSPFQPDASWLMVKLAGPERFVQYANFIDFKPDPDWTPTKPECTDHLPDGSHWFGTRMPPPDTAQPLTTEEVELVRKWIETGASSG